MIKRIFDNLFLAKQKSSLLTERKKLEKEMRGLDKFPSYGESEEDNAQEVGDYSDNLSIDKRLKDLYSKVIISLKKIDHGTYGICHNCHQMIDKARLEAFPTANTCLECTNKSS